MVDQALRVFADQLYEESRSYDATQADRLSRYRNLEPESAELLAVLATAGRPRRMLELGTSNGYSTLFLADAARDIGAALVSVDVDERRTAAAGANLIAAGVRSAVELQTRDAAFVLVATPDEWWDFIFLDAERPAYPGYWPDLSRTLTPGGLLVVDNVVSHADQVSEFRGSVCADPGFAMLSSRLVRVCWSW